MTNCSQFLRFSFSLLVASTCLAAPGCAWMRATLQLKDNMPRSLADRAREARADGDDDAALKLLQDAVVNDPDAPDVHREIAAIHMKRGEHDLAIEHLDRVVQLDPHAADGWAQLATALQKRGRITRAMAAADQALKLDGERSDALLVRAQALEISRPDDALEVCHRLLESDPGNVEARLAIARMHLRNGDADRAAPVLRSLCACPLADEHDKAEAWWALGIAYGRIGRWTDAVRALETGVDDREPTPDDLYRLAFAQRAAGELPDARRTLSELHSRHPDHPHGSRLAMSLEGFPEGVLPTSGSAVAVPQGW